METIMGDFTLTQLILMLLPIILLEAGLKVFCIVKALRYGVRNLSKGVWVLLILLVSTFGSIAFLLFGRKIYTLNNDNGTSSELKNTLLKQQLELKND